MGLLGRLAFAVLFWPVAVQAQAPPVQLVAPAFEERIAATVGEMWQVSPGIIQLQWGTLVGAEDLPEDTPFRLLGNGTDGWFAVLVERENDRPVAGRLRAGRMVTVPVTSRPLSAGHTLLDSDIVLGDRLVWGPPEPRVTVFASSGWTVSRSLRTGEVLTPPRVEPPLLVEAGDRVQLIWSGGRVKVAMEGRALNGAALGEEIRIMLDGARGRARGVVTGAGAAELTGRTQ
jgi:flagella basal body P-ring formation protein FlgA